MSNIQKNNKPNVPNLRFPEFSGEWKKSILKAECEINPKTGPLADTFQYIDLESVVKGQLIKVNYLKKEDAPSRAQRVLSKWDILYQCVRPYQLNNFLVRDNSSTQRVASTGYAQIRTNNNPDFFFQLLHTQKFTGRVINRCTGTNYPAINSTDLSEIEINIPEIKEQEKIGRMLSLIDQRIAIQNRLIEQYESLIKAIAFEIIGRNRSNTTLSDCVFCSSSTLKESELIDTGIPTYGAAGISGYTAEALCKSDSILITKDGSGVGSKRYVHGEHSFVGTLCSLTPKDGIYLPYVYYALMTMNLDTYKTGQAIPHIYFKDYGKLQLFCPTYSEQRRLSHGLETLDRKVEFEKNLLLSINEVKKGLLDQLFI